MNPEQWISIKWNGGSTMSDRWLNQSKIIQNRSKNLRNDEYMKIVRYYKVYGTQCAYVR